MRLTRLRVKNFRSIADIDIPLSPLTVLVGPNGSGKSNVETWFLAGITSIAAQSPYFADDLTYPNDPEAKRGAKEWLDKQMPATLKYKEVLHQEQFTRLLSFEQARRTPSFRRLERALQELLAAVDAKAAEGVVSPRR